MHEMGGGGGTLNITSGRLWSYGTCGAASVVFMHTALCIISRAHALKLPGVI